MTFGATLRVLRLQSGLGLRDLARRVGVSSTYLSRVESGLDPAPTPARLVNIARELGVPARTLIEIARRVSPLLVDYVEGVPEAGSLFVDIALRKLNAAQVAEVQAFVRARFAERGSEPRVTSGDVVELIAEDRVIVELRCRSMADALEIAAGRLAIGSEYDAATLATVLKARDAEVPSGLGAGVAVVGVAMPAIEPAAAVVTFAAPLEHPTPDAEPLRVLFVLVGPKGAPGLSPYVAQIVRLLDTGLVGALARAVTPAQVMALFNQLTSGE